MKNKGYLLLTVIALSAITFVACDSEKHEDTKSSKTEKTRVNDKLEVVDKEARPIDKPKESQRVDSFPWDEDASFKEAQDKFDTDVLISGFCTVLEKSTPEEKENIRLASETVNGTVVAPGEIFSQNKSIGPYTAEKGYKEGSGYVGNKIVKSMGGGVCKVATTLYNTSISSNLEIVERYNHAMPVPYVPYGQDAAVAYGFKDFKFKNNTEYPILIWTQIVENRVYMGFYGREQAPDVEWKHETLKTEPTTTEYKQNAELNKGEEKIIIEGMDGEVVESSVRIKDKDGVEQTKKLGKSSYLPMKRIIETNK